MIKMTSVAAQNGFGKLLDTVQREAVAITRHGRPTAFVVSPQDMEELLEPQLPSWSSGSTKNQGKRDSNKHGHRYT